MNLIVKMEFGSCLYGTGLPSSDTDLKAIYLPRPRDILLGKVKETIHTSTKTNNNQKNRNEDIDVETFSLKQYLKLLLEGQTVAIDCLFVPKNHILYPKNALEDFDSGYLWETIQENKHRFLHKRYSSFISYIYQQASKYGVKGSRMSALKLIIEYLDKAEPYWKLGNYINNNPLPHGEYIGITAIRNPRGEMESHLEVCGRKIAYHATIKYTKDIFQRIYDQYGERAKLAEKNDGIDWKALMHAVRISEQAVELLTTANIVFPRPNADVLLKIRKGELDYKAVAEMIEKGMEDIKIASEQSRLPEKPDFQYCDDLIFNVYKNHILGDKPDAYKT